MENCGIVGDMRTAALGGARSRDCRCTWIRDAAFTHLARISAAYNLDRAVG
jgi:hypothetical protein